MYLAAEAENGRFASDGDQNGAFAEYCLTRAGSLILLSRSLCVLTARHAAMQFATSGSTRFVTQVAAGTAELITTALEEVVAYKSFFSGRLRYTSIDSVVSTTFENPSGRDMPTAVGLQIVRVQRQKYVVLAGACAIGPDGIPSMLQPSTVSTWHLARHSKLRPMQLNVFVG